MKVILIIKSNILLLSLLLVTVTSCSSQQEQDVTVTRSVNPLNGLRVITRIYHNPSNVLSRSTTSHNVDGSMTIQNTNQNESVNTHTINSNGSIVSCYMNKNK